MARKRYQKGSIRLRGTVWTLRWREDVRLEDGSVKRVERTTVLGTKADIPTEKLARRRAEVILTNVNRPDYRPIKTCTFSQFVDRWRTQSLALMKPSTVNTSESHLRRHLLPKLGDLRLGEITQEVVQSLVALLAKKIGRVTILNVLGTLGSILRSARQWGYVASPFRVSDLRVPAARPSKRVKCFTAEQARAIIEAAEQPHRTIFAVASMTGLRPGEVLGLSIEDLDFENRLIYVRKSAWRSILQCPKNEASIGVVPMPQPLEVALRSYVATWSPNPKGLLFCTRKGNPFWVMNIVQRKLRPILDKLGIPRCGMHAFRHGHASLLISLGASPKVAQQQLRHSDPLTTMRTYAHVLGDEQRQAAERVARVVWPDVAKDGTPDKYIQ